MNYSIFFSTLIVLLSFSTFSCNKDDDNLVLPTEVSTAAELTEALNQIYENSEAPGFAVSVVKDDQVLYQKAFGEADLESGKAYTNQTNQPIGSISKTFVAAAVVKAIEQGHFTLETDINDILPVAITNPKQPNEVIRVKHLVTHTSGLLDVAESYFQAYHLLPGEDLSTEGSQLLQNAFGIQQRERVPLEDFLAEYYLEEGELYSLDNFADAAPGTSWNYSNIATSLTAYLIEVTSGSSFDQYIKTNILQPLGMSSTAYDLDELDPANLATLYWDKNTPLPLYGNDSYPDGGIVTNSDDLTRFLQDMMKGAKGQSATLFPAEGYEQLFEALLPSGLTSTGDNQGVFWFLDGGNIAHDGSDPGTTCSLLFDEMGQAGYFLMTNMDASSDENIAAWNQLSSKVNAVLTEFILAN